MLTAKLEKNGTVTIYGVPYKAELSKSEKSMVFATTRGNMPVEFVDTEGVKSLKLLGVNLFEPRS